MKIPKKGILAKVLWRDVTVYDKTADERGRDDMVKKCSIGLVKPGKTPKELRIISEWDEDECSARDGYDLVLTKDAIDDIIPLVEKKCSTKKNPKKK